MNNIDLIASKSAVLRHQLQMFENELFAFKCKNTYDAATFSERKKAIVEKMISMKRVNEDFSNLLLNQIKLME